ILNNPHTMRALSIVSDNAYNTVTVHDLPREEARVLFTNRSSSSKLAENPEQRFAYIRYIDEIFLAPLRASNPPRDILMIGAGGFTLGLEDAHNRYTYVDIDPALKDVAETYFLKKPLLPNKRFVATSARAFLHGQSQAYDLIVVDVYTNMIAVPMETTTREFLREVKRALKPDGIVVANVIMTPDFRDRFSVRYDHTFGSVFPVFTRQVVKPFNPWEPEPKPANVLYIYYNRPGMNDTAIYTDDKNTYSLDR
ncbi:MAG: fused MFS/spermidine synthase, partial [Alphaproteobacteria bacterium]|nr:fused MFS/spermidine synthase [Alphaproteobacteria bacterium]